MMLDFGLIALILIIVLWVIQIVTATRREKRHFALADRLAKAEKTIRDQRAEIAALDSKVAQLEIEVSNIR